MDDVKIFRLITGEDIISYFVYDDLRDEVFIDDPMVVYIKHKQGKTDLILQHYLPVEVIKENSIIIKGRDILTIMHPSDSLYEYYTNSVAKIKKELIAKQKIKDEDTDDMMDIMDALEESVFQTLH